MLSFAPDFARRIDLPGAGPCPRPVDIDRTKTHFGKLVSLRVYSFAQGVAIDGEAEADEVFVVLLRGAADVGVESTGRRVGEFPLRADGGLRAVYLPPHASYRLSACDDCDIAYARVQPPRSQLNDADGFAPVSGSLSIVGYAAGMDLSLETIATGDARPLVGRDDDDLPERFVHVRSDDGGVADLAGGRLGDWDSAALGAGERATLQVAQGTVDILTIAALAH